MTEEKLRRMVKYAELIKNCAFDVGVYWGDEDWYNYGKREKILLYLIHRMEREMKR